MITSNNIIDNKDKERESFREESLINPRKGKE